MFLFCLVFAMSLCASIYMCFVVTCWERADLLALVCGVFCEFVTFPLVSWVRCGTRLYRFLIFAPLLTLTWRKHIEDTATKANKTLGFVRQNLSECTSQVKSVAYTTMVRPRLEYSSTVWDPHLTSDVHTLEQV